MNELILQILNQDRNTTAEFFYETSSEESWSLEHLCKACAINVQLLPQELQGLYELHRNTEVGLEATLGDDYVSIIVADTNKQFFFRCETETSSDSYGVSYVSLWEEVERIEQVTYSYPKKTLKEFGFDPKSDSAFIAEYLNSLEDTQQELLYRSSPVKLIDLSGDRNFFISFCATHNYNYEEMQHHEVVNYESRGGHEGGGEHVELIIQLVDMDMYFKCTAYYASYSGISDWSPIYPVVAKKVEVLKFYDE